MNAQTAIVPRTTIAEIEGRRAHAIALFGKAQDALHEAMKAAAAAAGGTSFHFDDETARMMLRAANDDNPFLEAVTRRTDQTIWRYLLTGFGFDKLLDRQAMDEFRAHIDKNPPEVTAETAEATLLHLLGEADMMFKRGIANAFSSLERRFRSHDGFKIGDRIILDRAFSPETGSWNHHMRREDTLRDIERVFLKLDGQEMSESYAGIVGQINTVRIAGGYRPQAFVAENDYFKVKAFLNGNAHLWFKRDDLVEKVNLLLAEYYGAALGDDSDDVKKEDPLKKRSTAVARNMGWFPTPVAVANRAVDDAAIYRGALFARSEDPRPIRILEPSAGEGAIISRILSQIAEDGGMDDVPVETVCVELNPERAAKLRSIRGVDRVVQEDFLALDDVMLGGMFDRIVMNPPFAREVEIDHVVHAVSLLAPGGILVAILPAGVEFASSKRAVAFRDMVEQMNGDMRDLPAGSFAESGTMVNTLLLTLRKRLPMC